MKISLKSLREFIEYDEKTIDSHIISRKLNEIGVENEILENYSYLETFQVAQIVSVEQHPNATGLKICKVADGDENILQIICGASNVKPYMKVVLAKLGTNIPSTNKKIKKSKIKDYMSEGMLCSYDELSLDYLSSQENSIIELSSNAQNGDQIIQYLNLPYHFDIDVTPNRGEILSIYGLAKEIASSGLVKMKKIPKYLTEESELFESQVKLHIDKTICPVVSIRELSNINNQVKLPDWFKSELQDAEIKSVSPIIDIANYTTYKFGQPLHIYDKNQIDPEIFIKTLGKDYSMFKGLDKMEYVATQGDIVVQGPNNTIYSLAGILGSLNSSCDLDTKNILIEAAIFDSTKISVTSNRLQLKTDAQSRFEKNINWDLLNIALDYTTKLILEFCGGKASHKITQQDHLKEKTLIFSKKRFYKQIGCTIDAKTIDKILLNLNFSFQNISDDKVNIKVPYWRKDLEIQEDMNEEILRIYGYDNIEYILPGDTELQFLDEKEKYLLEIRKILSARGYYESISYSFTDKNKVDDFDDIYQELELLNPISADINYMRPSLLINYLPVIEKNINKSYKNFSLFEIGKIFNGTRREEIRKLILIRVGLKNHSDFFDKETKFDLFDLKTDLQMILDHLNINTENIKYVSNNLPKYVISEAAINIESIHGTKLGYFGEIDRNITSKYNLHNSNLLVMELNIDDLLNMHKFDVKKTQYSNISYQPLIREYNFIMNKHIELGDVIQFLYKIDENKIQNVRLIDIHDESEDKKAVTFSLKIQDQTNNLSDTILKKLHEKIINKTENKFLCKIKDQKT